VSAYSDAVNALARRGLTVHECRARLLDRGHAASDVDEAISRLIEVGSLDDAKLARAVARTGAETKGRGRLRVLRELQARGVDRTVAAEAVGEVFGDKDERSLVSRAIQRKLRGRAGPKDAAEAARLYQYLMRQGFSPAAATAAIRKLRGSTDDEVQ
jgi:regulatory protein